MGQQFQIQLEQDGTPSCLLEYRTHDFSRVERLGEECMREVDGLSCVGCSGGRRKTIKIHGSSVQSVIEAVNYCTESSTVVPG